MTLTTLLRRPIPVLLASFMCGSLAMLLAVQIAGVSLDAMGGNLSAAAGAGGFAQSDRGFGDRIAEVVLCTVFALGLFGAFLLISHDTSLPAAATMQVPPTQSTATNLTLPTDVAQTSSKFLEAELANVLAVIRTGIGASESYAKSLGEAQKRLAALPTAEQVRVIVSLLAAENQRMRLDMTSLTSELEGARSKIESLRTNLAQAHEVGLRDSLTSIGNRRCFDSTLEHALAAAAADGAPLSIVMADIDAFKKVNDEYGHQIGDEVLKIFAKVLTASVRDRDTVTRFGGEEFAIILPNTTGKDAELLAERIRQKFEQKALKIRKTNKPVGQMTASFGVAQMRQGETTDVLVQRADSRLYEAKRTGRNRVVR